ncbi:MAG: fibronectin type III domain-containing protein [Treponema sp.]|nr:fibronectin type III domain-containing protein [Treponema sp.]
MEDEVKEELKKIAHFRVESGDSEVNLSWENPDSKDFTGTLIEWFYSYDNNENELIGTKTLDTSNSFFSITGLENGRSYLISITVLYSGGRKSEATSNFAFPEDKTPPANVTDLKAVQKRDGIRVFWTNPNDKDFSGLKLSYYFMYKGRSNRDSINLTSDTESFLLDKNLIDNVLYTFTVSAHDVYNNYSSEESVQIAYNSSLDDTIPISLYEDFEKYTGLETTIHVSVGSGENAGISSIKYRLDGFEDEEIEVIDSSEYEVTVNKNGSYIFIVTDSDGYEYLKTISVASIEAVPSISNEKIEYDAVNSELVLSWNNSLSVDKVEISYEENGVQKSETVTGTSYSFSFDGESELSVTLIPLNINSDEGEEVILTYTPQVIITEMIFSKSRFTANDAGKTFDVTVSGKNFDCMTTSQKFRLSASMHISEYSTQNPTVSEFSVNYSNNTARATVTLPSKLYAPTNGSETTFSLYLYDAVSSSLSSALIKRDVTVYSNPAVTSVETSISEISEAALESDASVNVTVRGTNLDLADSIYLQFFDNDNNAIEATKIDVDVSAISSSTSFSVDVPLVIESGYFKLKCYLNNKLTSYSATVHIFGSPEFRNITFPAVSSTYVGKEIPFTVTGVNFLAPGLRIADFKFVCKSGSTEIPESSTATISITDDSTITVSMTSPGEGTYKLIISYKENSFEKDFSVKNYGSYVPGDVIAADGVTKVSKDDVGSYDFTAGNAACAVIFGTNEYGVPLAVGIEESPLLRFWVGIDYTSLSLTQDLAKRRFNNLICTPQSRNIDENPETTGDKDGSDNFLEWIKAMGVESWAKNDSYETAMPAYYWANHYAEKAEITGTMLDDNKWYMPSIDELIILCKNVEAVNASLASLGKTQMKYASANDKEYWSSSQYISGGELPYSAQDYEYNWVVKFSSNYTYCSKANKGNNGHSAYVRVIHIIE